MKNNESTFIPMNLSFFGEGEGANGNKSAGEGSDESAGASDTKSGSGGKETEKETKKEARQDSKQEPTNYEELFATDKAFQSFLDKHVTKATQTAVANALAKQQRLTDEKLSESERLKEMTAEQRASYFEKKYKEGEKARARDKEIESLRAQTTDMLTEANIPLMFLDIFDFTASTAEDIKQRVTTLSEYEYHPKGELDKRITAGVNEKLKQKPPETRQTDSDPNDLFMQGFNGGYRKNPARTE